LERCCVCILHRDYPLAQSVGGCVMNSCLIQATNLGEDAITTQTVLGFCHAFHKIITSYCFFMSASSSSSSLLDHSFLSYAPDISVKNALTDLVTLTSEPQNSSLSLLGYPKVIPCTKFEHFVFISLLFELCCRQTDRQTDKQMDSKILPMPTMSVV